MKKIKAQIKASSIAADTTTEHHPASHAIVLSTIADIEKILQRIYQHNPYEYLIEKSATIANKTYIEPDITVWIIEPFQQDWINLFTRGWQFQNQALQIAGKVIPAILKQPTFTPRDRCLLSDTERHQKLQDLEPEKIVLTTQGLVSIWHFFNKLQQEVELETIQQENITRFSNTESTPPQTTSYVDAISSLSTESSASIEPLTLALNKDNVKMSPTARALATKQQNKQRAKRKKKPVSNHAKKKHKRECDTLRNNELMTQNIELLAQHSHEFESLIVMLETISSAEQLSSLVIDTDRHSPSTLNTRYAQDINNLQETHQNQMRQLQKFDPANTCLQLALQTCIYITLKFCIYLYQTQITHLSSAAQYATYLCNTHQLITDLIDAFHRSTKLSINRGTMLDFFQKNIAIIINDFIYIAQHAHDQFYDSDEQPAADLMYNDLSEIITAYHKLNTNICNVLQIWDKQPIQQENSSLQQNLATISITSSSEYNRSIKNNRILQQALGKLTYTFLSSEVLLTSTPLTAEWEAQKQILYNFRFPQMLQHTNYIAPIKSTLQDNSTCTYSEDIRQIFLWQQYNIIHTELDNYRNTLYLQLENFIPLIGIEREPDKGTGLANILVYYRKRTEAIHANINDIYATDEDNIMQKIIRVFIGNHACIVTTMYMALANLFKNELINYATYINYSAVINNTMNLIAIEYYLALVANNEISSENFCRFLEGTMLPTINSMLAIISGVQAHISSTSEAYIDISANLNNAKIITESLIAQIEQLLPLKPRLSVAIPQYVSNSIKKIVTKTAQAGDEEIFITENTRKILLQQLPPERNSDEFSAYVLQTTSNLIYITNELLTGNAAQRAISCTCEHNMNLESTDSEIGQEASVDEEIIPQPHHWAKSSLN
jgi:hypothetical protein